MVSSEGGKGLRHKPRHMIMNKLTGQLGLDEHPEWSIILKWGIFSDVDPRVDAILARLGRVCLRLSADDSVAYLRAAEHIAAAEKAKAEWNPKATRARYSHLARSAREAAELLKELNVLFPPPWAGERAPLGALMEGLASLIAGAVGATHPDLKRATIRASAGVQTAKKLLSRRGGIRWELLRDLVWLASGRRAKPDERTVRRYLEDQRGPKNPAGKYWESNWKLLTSAAQLAPQTHADAFTDALKLYLQSPVKS
jgi:hypothetical protein